RNVSCIMHRVLQGSPKAPKSVLSGTISLPAGTNPVPRRTTFRSLPFQPRVAVISLSCWAAHGRWYELVGSRDQLDRSPLTRGRGWSLIHTSPGYGDDRKQTFTHSGETDDHRSNETDNLPPLARRGGCVRRACGHRDRFCRPV